MNDYLYILENNRRVNIYASLKYMLQKIFPYVFFINVFYYKCILYMYFIINFYANFFILYVYFVYFM